MLKYVVPFLLCLASWAQNTERPNPTLTALNQIEAQKIAAQREAANNITPANLEARLQQYQVAHAVLERQAQLRRDTEKLVSLTAELKEHVDKAGLNILSMEVIRKAEEIQKLAKSVQDKMKNAY
jgi:spore germination protein YaaH